jgi:hypothetical protein
MYRLAGEKTLTPHFEAIRISLASPEKIRAWSHGHVTKPETSRRRKLWTIIPLIWIACILVFSEVGGQTPAPANPFQHQTQIVP